MGIQVNFRDYRKAEQSELSRVGVKQPRSGVLANAR
jgi:hypothetical protein